MNLSISGWRANCVTHIGNVFRQWIFSAMVGGTMKEIRPDATLLVAVERSVTGASTHKIRCLLFQYELACYVGNKLLAQSAELALRRTLLDTERRGSAVAARKKYQE